MFVWWYYIEKGKNRREIYEYKRTLIKQNY